MDKTVAQGFFGVLVSKQLRQNGMGVKELASVAKIPPKVVVDAKEGKVDPKRQYELKKLIAVLFLAGTKRRKQAFRYLLIIVPTSRPQYRMVRRCRSHGSFAPQRR